MLVRVLIIIAVILWPIGTARPADESLGDSIKKIFATPTPTPHRRKKVATATKKKWPTPTPTPWKKSLPPREAEPSSPTPSPKPGSKKKKVSSNLTETPASTATPHRAKKTSPTPAPTETPTPTPTPPTSAGKKHGAPNVTLRPDDIKGFENYPPKVQQLLNAALELTTRNLDYKYGSADPASGGMDCSGFVYYVLKQNGITDAPRDSSEQYIWVRRARAFESVLSEKDDSFELEDLKPGDLLFWTGTYSIERDPPITHAMIYLGREKKTGKRVMVGASDGRVYENESRYGVSVFDFTIKPHDSNGKLRPTFVGYGHVPGLRDQPAQPSAK
jgi:cell wall-associated NlpC family hydrolase